MCLNVLKHSDAFNIEEHLYVTLSTLHFLSPNNYLIAMAFTRFNERCQGIYYIFMGFFNDFS